MILCRTKEAQNPFVVEHTGIKIYTLEELCYYIYNNIYLIGKEFISEGLLTFIRVETEEDALADRLEYLVQNQAGLAEMVVTILKYVDYYAIGEIEEIREILKTLNSQNVHERMKSRGDSYLKNQTFYSAIRCYEQIVLSQPDQTLSGLFYAGVHHNMGVAYARMFLFKEAADCFRQAYKIGQHEESHKCFMAAERMMMSENIIEREDATEEEYVLKREIETLVDNARYSDEYRKLSEINELKEKGKVAEYNHAVDDCMLQWRNEYQKYTS